MSIKEIESALRAVIATDNEAREYWNSLHPDERMRDQPRSDKALARAEVAHHAAGVLRQAQQALTFVAQSGHLPLDTIMRGIAEYHSNIKIRQALKTMGTD